MPPGISFHRLEGSACDALPKQQHCMHSPELTDGAPPAGTCCRGNVIWNGGPDMPLGIDGGCPASTPTCNPTQVRPLPC